MQSVVGKLENENITYRIHTAIHPDVLINQFFRLDEGGNNLIHCSQSLRHCRVKH